MYVLKSGLWLEKFWELTPEIFFALRIPTLTWKFQGMFHCSPVLKILSRVIVISLFRII